MSEAQSSDAMKNLVKFMICLAILGTIIALVAYFGIILPSREALLQASVWNCGLPECHAGIGFSGGARNPPTF